MSSGVGMMAIPDEASVEIESTCSPWPQCRSTASLSLPMSSLAGAVRSWLSDPCSEVEPRLRRRAAAVTCTADPERLPDVEGWGGFERWFVRAWQRGARVSAGRRQTATPVSPEPGLFERRWLSERFCREFTPAIDAFLRERPEVAGYALGGIAAARRLFGQDAEYHLHLDVDPDSGERSLIVVVLCALPAAERRRLDRQLQREWGYRAMAATSGAVLLLVGAK